MKNAEKRLEHGARFPYDAPDSWNEAYPSEPAPVASDWAQSAARGVLADLLDRRGIKQLLEDLDEDVRVEMVTSLAEIIRTASEAGNLY